MRERLTRMVDRAERWIVGRASLVLLATAVFSALCVAQLVDLRTGRPLIALDPSISGILPSDDEGRAYFEEIKQRFSSGEVVLLALVADDIFTFENLSAIQQISRSVEDLAEVERVASLSLSLNIRSEDGALVTRPFYDRVPQDDVGLVDLRERALADPIYAGNLVSRDGRVSVVLVHLLDLPEQEILESRIDDRIREIAASSWRPGEFWMSGSVPVKAEMSRLMLRDSTVVVPLAALVIAIVALVSFRSVRGVAIPVLSVSVSALATLAFISVAYGSLNQITAAVPSIMIVVGFAYSVHIVSAYYDAARSRADGGDRETSCALLALRNVAKPVLFTGLTTAAGFASLATSSFASIQQYGIAAAVGVLVSMVVSLTFSPALLEVLPTPVSIRRPTSDRIDRALARLARFDIRHRRSVLWVGAGIAIVSGLGVSQIIVGTQFVGSFKADNPVRQDFDRINDHLEGANSFNIILTATGVAPWKRPENLRVIETLQDWLATQSEVGGSTSLVDYVKALYRGIEGGHPEYHTIPESAHLVSQLLVVGATAEVDDYVDDDFRTANVVVRTSAMDSIEVKDLVDRIEQHLGELPAAIQARVTGNTVLISRTMDDIAMGQAKSLAAASVVIYLILAILFSSFRMAAIAFLPNALPVLVFFGILGWSGLQLNASTGLVACIMLGIAVDDTIHLCTHFSRAAKRHANEARGVVEAMGSVGRPVTITTLALCGGFGCLVLSEMQPQVEFAWLAAATLLVAWLVDVTFTLALAASLRIVTNWDVLARDLGGDPHAAIPLFEGLTAAQARIAVQSARIFEVPGGHRPSKDVGRERGLYMVIEPHALQDVRRRYPKIGERLDANLAAGPDQAPSIHSRGGGISYRLTPTTGQRSPLARKKDLE